MHEMGDGVRDKACQLLRTYSSYEGWALENHCLRLAQFTLALGKEHGVAMDEELIWSACYVHDIGLLVDATAAPDYLVRGWRFLKPLVVEWGLEGDRLVTFRDAILYNHALRPVRGAGVVAEMCRRAVQVEHSRGLLRHGLGRSEVRGVFHDIPRLDLSRVLADFAKITLLRDGPSALRTIFAPEYCPDATELGSL